jgi:uncharacterized membrane protein YozB (DUF420 family)
MAGLNVFSLPAVDAILNGTSAVFLIVGHRFAGKRRIGAHRACMLIAFACSTLFLACYLYFHYCVGVVRFSGKGWVRPAYFALLISHTVLAAVIVPLVLISLYMALTNQFSRHSRVARWTYPLWVYVSVTGVIVYWVLYRLYSPIYPPRIAAILPSVLGR